MENPLVSIITVVYDGETTIKDTIESVLNQTYNNIEYLIIDGNSKDNTLRIIKEYEEKFEEKGIIYKWISEPDNGIFNAMNKGIKLANGELIGIINSDDWYELDAVELVVDEYLKNNSHDIYHGDVKYHWYPKNEEYEWIQKPRNLVNMGHDMSINHPTAFVKKPFYETYGCFDESYPLAADWDLFLKAYLRGAKFKYIPKTMANFRLGGASDSWTRKLVLERRKIMFKNGFNLKLQFLYEWIFMAGVNLLPNIFYYYFRVLTYRKKDQFKKVAR